MGSVLEQNATSQDRSPLVEGAARRLPWLVTHVEALPEYQLFVRFEDGTEGRVEMRAQIFSEQAGVFASLRDADVFRQVGIEGGAVVWANGLDIAPDASYEDIKRSGVQVLT